MRDGCFYEVTGWGAAAWILPDLLSRYLDCNTLFISSDEYYESFLRLEGKAGLSFNCCHHLY